MGLQYSHSLFASSQCLPIPPVTPPRKEEMETEIQLNVRRNSARSPYVSFLETELELELIQTQMAQKPMLRAEVGMRVRCANKASAE